MKIFIHDKKRYLAAYLAFTLVFCAILFLLTYLGAYLTELPNGIGDTPTAREGASEITVVIDAGHGGEDGGAIGINGVYEKELNLQIALYTDAILRSNGINTVLTRDEDVLLYDKSSDYQGHKKEQDLLTRRKITEAYENAVFVSIHMNAFTEEKYSGLQVYYSKNDPLSQPLAERIQSLTKEAIQPENNRKVKTAGNNIYLLDRLECPAVLIECGFLSNREECERLCDEEYQKKLALCFATAICEQIIVTKDNSGT